MNNNEFGHNRRKFMRLEASSTVSYSDSPDPAISHPARFTDITREGMRMISDRPLDLDSKVSLAFQIPGDTFPILADGSTSIGPSFDASDARSAPAVAAAPPSAASPTAFRAAASGATSTSCSISCAVPSSPSGRAT